MDLQYVKTLYRKPLLDLVFEAADVHRQNHDHHEMQLCTLLSIKTGGCTEDCKYCSQSIHNQTMLEKEILLKTDKVLEEAKKAKDSGSTRFCMGAAWREVQDGRGFERVLDMVKGVKGMGMEVCCTLGMLTEDQAKKLKEAGLTAYNHNLDTSEEFYSKVISTRTYKDRLDTIDNVAKAGISLCCGGILGMGESQEDRISLLHRLANLNPQPESVPINMLVPVEGTPLDKAAPLDIFEWIRCIAVARILMPRAMVRLSAGRLQISREAQALAFMAGANAIFTGEKLLTTPNPEFNEDNELLKELGLKPRAPYKDEQIPKKLQQLEDTHRLRSLTLPNGIDLTSNDYLGLKSHRVLRETAIKALEEGIDIGAGGSRLLRGQTEAHKNLEEFAARYFDCEKTLYFATGFQANHALFTTLPDRHDVIIFDEFIHASVREAIQNSPAKHIKIPHNDLNAFTDAVKNAQKSIGAETVWIAVESVYSMDGDRAPLRELALLAEKYNALLMVDEAHATGIFGKTGKGLAQDVAKANVITLHTCGKALGVAGGLVCAPGDIIDTLVNRARGFIYSTAPMPLQALLVQKALGLVEEESWRRELFDLMKAAQRLLAVNVQSPIIPVILGDDGRALDVARDLQGKGFDVRAIRPPTVPEGTARLRVSLNCNLDEKILKNFAAALAPHLQKRAA